MKKKEIIDKISAELKIVIFDEDKNLLNTILENEKSTNWRKASLICELLNIEFRYNRNVIASILEC